MFSSIEMTPSTPEIKIGVFKVKDYILTYDTLIGYIFNFFLGYRMRNNIIYRV